MHKYAFRSHLIFLGLFYVSIVEADCISSAGTTYDINVVCDTSVPNPYLTNIQPAPGVTANILLQPGAQVSISGGGNGVLIWGGSLITNNGTVLVNINDVEFFDALSARGDNNQIFNFGTLNTTGLRSEGIYTNGTNSSFLNAGTIHTTSDLSDGIISDRGSSGNTLINQGTITTDGDGSSGMEAFGDNHALTNENTIITTGSDSYGLKVDGSNSVLTNQSAGVITTSGTGADGLEGIGSNHQLVNQGSINTTGNSAAGIFAYGDGSQLNNESSIITSGNSAHGIYANGNNLQIVNQGSILVNGESSDGIRSIGSTSQNLGSVINSGQIETQGSFGDGIMVSNPATVTNTTNASVHSAGGEGINFISGGVLNNDGSVRSDTSYGVYMGGNAQITNTTHGNILGTSAIYNNAGTTTLNNQGILTGQNGAAIFLPGNNASTIVNSGTLQGGAGNAIVTGDGNDSFTLTDGTVIGNIEQNGGIDSVNIQNGIVTGAISQGTGIDDFVMSGGQIGSLAQGDGLDTFTMTSGSIVGAFVDGDAAQMSGGTIGRVDMRLANNIFNMSGGRIIGNLVAGFGNDSITLSAGEIGGNISVSGGTDSVIITGGTVQGEVRMSAGNDSFLWENGGAVNGAILMGEDNDNAVLRGLSAATLSSTPSIDGGTGTDNLTIDNTIADNPARFIDWENIALNNQSQLIVNSPLTLGDAVTRTGTLSLDSSSAIVAGGLGASSIQSSDGSDTVTVNNAGTIDLTGGSQSMADSLTIHGNYVGEGSSATLKLQTELGDENSPTDKLIISGGSASGQTGIQVTNINGIGAYTNGNGIELVSAINGATTSTTAFSLNGGSMSAGAYEYVLFHGGATAGSENSWYLRNTLIAPPITPEPSEPTNPTEPTDPGTPTTPTNPAEPGNPAEPTNPGTPTQPGIAVPTPAPGSPALPAAVSGRSAVPLYRQETPMYSVLPPVVFKLGMTALGTYHEREGGQPQLTGNTSDPEGWARIFGTQTDQHWSGDAAPSFDGNFTGVQVGQDIYAHQYDNGQRDHAGLFYGYTHVDGDIHGFILGFPDADAGTLNMHGNSLGGYWTHLWPNQAYIDAVVMHTWLDGDVNSGRGVNSDVKGKLLTGSIESGLPFAITDRWTLEPQAQIIAQHESIDDADDGISSISYGSDTLYTGRIGARLQGNYTNRSQVLQPYLKVNVWHDFKQNGSVLLANDSVDMQYESTSLEIGLGVVAAVNDNVSLYAAASQNSDLDDQYRRDYSGNLGVKIRW
ncbi:autotransporter outer membrane beta-barrel domain-containing protein [Edaphovirga cremea]|uniref:autotransporter outer membrane beta-barrel domain-containing protein n=1 Tax=Edaphovirga cremea TaxID=2267246 RepID=UPI001B86328C|nr:autotransporter outer membrane beta-barrel domain-containing protein [Edaphovirga cremea]